MHYYKVRDIADTLKDSFNYLSANGKNLLRIWVLFAAPLFLLHYFLLSKLPIANIMEQFEPEMLLGFNGLNAIDTIMGPLYPLVIITAILSQATSIVIILEHIKCTMDSVPINPEDMSSLLPKILGFSVLYFIISMILGISLLFFFFPFLFVGTKLAVTFQSYIIGEKSLIDSLVHSWNITTYQAWPTFGLLIILILITIMISSLIQIPSEFIRLGLEGTTWMGSDLGEFIFTLISGLFNVLTALATIIFQTVLSFHFFNLSARYSSNISTMNT
ncbi:MAG: hypothetical protein CL669_03770 [Balneola sp.]|nr:hypothetical protein [Balneola sp.]